MNDIRDPKCRLCDLHKSCKTVCLMGQGPKKAKIMFVGEAPGATEDKGGLPFQGKAGQLLNRLLLERGIKRADVYVTNAVKCRPPENATPNRTQVKACNPYLIQEINRVKPEIIVTLGNIPLQAVLKRSGIMKYRGEAIEETFGNHTCTVLPTVHPAAALRNPKNKPLLEADLDNLKNIIEGGSGRNIDEQKKFKVHFVMNRKMLGKCLRALEKAYQAGSYIAYDIETEGNNPFTPNVYGNPRRIWMISIADKDNRAWVIPLEHEESPWKDKANKILKLLRKYLETPSFWKIAQNGKFDNRWLRKRGLKPYLNFDTMLAQHLIDENAPKGLDFLATVYFNAPNWGKGRIVFEDRFSKTGAQLEAVTGLKEMGRYCGIDTIYTRKLYPPLRDKLMEDEKTARIFKFISMPASRMLEETETKGLWVNRKRLGERYQEACHKLNETLEKLESYVPDNFWELQGKKKPKGIKTKINWNSTAQLSMFFFSPKKKGGLGLKVIERTPTGNPSTAEHTMLELEGVHPACDLLLEYRKWFKYLSTYIEPWLEKSDNPDWRLHPNFKIYGTVTGRISSEDPNPQQVPRDPFLRATLGAPPGYKLIEADYSQIELRVVAFLSGDPRMNRAYLLGEDIHTLTASNVMQIPVSMVDGEARKKAKAVNFGFVYGMSWRKFKRYAKDSYGIDLTDDEARRYRENFFKLYKGLPAWHERQRRIAKKTKQVRAPHGRIRRLPDVDSDVEGIQAEALRQAINSPVQGFASGDLTLLAAVLFDRIMKKHLNLKPQDVQVTLLVHDAIIVEVKEELVDKVTPILKGVMENTPLLDYFDLDFSIPIVADVAVGQHWGEGKELDNVTYDKDEISTMIKEVMWYDEETS